MTTPFELRQSSENPLWSPSSAHTSQLAISRFAEQVKSAHQQQIRSYDDLLAWSIDHKEDFWNDLWDFCDVIGDRGEPVFTAANHLIESRWFPNARLNYAENLLQHALSEPDNEALVFWGEDQVTRKLSNRELLQEVAGCQTALKALGIQAGDRVVGFLPNCPEAIIAMLATTALGAIWSSASPDFGVDGVLDRFGQIEPKVMFCTDGYLYGGQWIDCRKKNEQVSLALTTLTCCVEVAYDPNKASAVASHKPWSDFISSENAASPTFNRISFDHPLFIMFSSGTTGIPKCIVHGHGGSLLQHMKEHQLHSDVRRGDRVFYFTTCGWMMWNWLASALASGATLMLYDGNPFTGSKQVLFDYAAQERISHFGISAKFIEAANKFGLNPAESHDLSELRAVFSTGSPLAPEGFDFVYQKLNPNVLLASISGGTDILSCFALGNPALPVYSGQLQCIGLGMAVAVYDDDGNERSSGKGDLVCTESFPSMPIGFWADTNNEKYMAAYFEDFENVWCHGDYVELTPEGGMIIHGRSDAVLNPGGVRIGTAEIYRQVETVPEVLESIVVGQEWQNDVRVILFVVLQTGIDLDELLVKKIKQTIRDKATPRHVPGKIIAVSDI
ncbi:MAG: acetoacetate--CoA ligase, partial [Pseudomonadota bacterium]